MNEHNQYVKEVTPSERFHMMELSEGWAPLCKVLKAPIPTEPFPRANDAEAIQGLAGKIFIEAISRWMVILIATSFIGFGAWWSWGRNAQASGL